MSWIHVSTCSTFSIIDFLALPTDSALLLAPVMHMSEAARNMGFHMWETNDGKCISTCTFQKQNRWYQLRRRYYIIIFMILIVVMIIYTTFVHFWPIRNLHFTVIWGISQLSKHGSIWLASMHMWHKLVNTLVFVDMKFNPRLPLG